MSGNDYSLSDLAADAGVSPDSDAESSGGSMLDAMRFLEDRGYLKQILAASDMGGQIGETNADAQAIDTMENTDTPTDSGDNVELDAQTISQFGRLVIDEFGDVPVSQVVKFADSNPDQLNQAIHDQLGDGGGE